MPKRTTTFGEDKLMLDARPDRLDLRDLVYRPPLGNLPPEFPDDTVLGTVLPKYLGAGLILNQGSEGACTGFGLAAVINYLLWLEALKVGRSFDVGQLVSPRMLYHLAKFYDEWEGEDYDGSSCRGALKGWHRHGVCLETLWPFCNGSFVRPGKGWDEDALRRPLGVYYRISKDSVVDMQAAIKDVGAIFVSSQVHAGWTIRGAPGDVRSHDDLPVIVPNHTALGGHAYAIVGYNGKGFVVQNSWGSDWGRNGFAILTYGDWVAHGSDAWAVAMGVPAVHHKSGVADRIGLSARRRATPIGQAIPGFGGNADPLAKQRDVWSSEQAYRHTLVTGNDGYIINRLPQLENAGDAVKFLTLEEPMAWFGAQKGGGPWRLAVYAHGGLNSEADSIQRIRVLGPNFLNNGIYPLFVSWKSGWKEILTDMLEDAWKGVFGAAGVPAQGIGDTLIEASDRTLEVACRYLAVRGMWSEMKENVARATGAGCGLNVLGKQIKALSDAASGKLEIHLIGHSAGSFVTGRLLGELAAQGLKAGSCTLFAPACGLDFALRHYGQAVTSNCLPGAKFHIHMLSDERELDDSVGPYRKSLLYLVSRALERVHKTPLLGMETAFASPRPIEEIWNDDDVTVKDVTAWQAFFGSGSHGSRSVLADKQVDTGTSRIDTSHGCFDNSQFHIKDAIQRILGGNLNKRLTSLDY